MPSLMPIAKEDIQPIGLKSVFESPKKIKTVERVINFLRPFYENYSNKSFEEISRANTITEEFFLLMPTAQAFVDEVELCKAILKHSSGAMSDAGIKAVLTTFISSHTYSYSGDTRTVKRGDFNAWGPDNELVYLSTDGFGFTCNPIQSYLVRYLHADLSFKTVKL